MIEAPRLMLIEDDQQLADLLTEYFQGYGFQVDWLASGAQADRAIVDRSPDLVVLDLMLPGQDGLSICSAIRKRYSGKILVLTASGDDMDQVAALEMGADDFVQKPIQPRVLLARVKMLLRRSNSNEGDGSGRQIRFGGLVINQTLKRCTLNDSLVALTPSEFAILSYMANHPDQVLSRQTLLECLSGLEYDGLNRTVDNKIAQLRKKLNDNAQRPMGIITVRGKGYMFVPDYW